MVRKHRHNLSQVIRERAAGEDIEAVVIGHTLWGKNDDDGQDDIRGAVMTWRLAQEILDYEFDDTYGTGNCHAVYAWTKDRLIVISEYDNSLQVIYLPRHPVSGIPEFV